MQNLIAQGHRETVITALKMDNQLDAGSIYMKRPLSLEGLAEEIFIRASHIDSKDICIEQRRYNNALHRDKAPNYKHSGIIEKN